MNDKKMIWLLTFVIFLLLSCLPHDIYQIGLAGVSIMLFGQIAMIFNSRWTRTAVYCIGGIACAQIGVTLRQGFMIDGFYKTFAARPLGMIVGDVIYGFRQIFVNVYLSVVGMSEAIMYKDLSVFNTLNYRLTIIGWMVILTLGSVLLAEADERKVFEKAKARLAIKGA